MVCFATLATPLSLQRHFHFCRSHLQVLADVEVKHAHLVLMGEERCQRNDSLRAENVELGRSNVGDSKDDPSVGLHTELERLRELIRVVIFFFILFSHVHGISLLDRSGRILLVHLDEFIRYFLSFSQNAPRCRLEVAEMKKSRVVLREVFLGVPRRLPEGLKGPVASEALRGFLVLVALDLVREFQLQRSSGEERNDGDDRKGLC